MIDKKLIEEIKTSILNLKKEKKFFEQQLKERKEEKHSKLEELEKQCQQHKEENKKLKNEIITIKNLLKSEQDTILNKASPIIEKKTNQKEETLQVNNTNNQEKIKEKIAAEDPFSDEEGMEDDNDFFKNFKE